MSLSFKSTDFSSYFQRSEAVVVSGPNWKFFVLWGGCNSCSDYYGEASVIHLDKHCKYAQQLSHFKIHPQPYGCAAVTYKNRMFVYGGTTDLADPPSDDNLYIYNFKGAFVQRKLNGDVPPPLLFPTMVTFKNHLYILLGALNKDECNEYMYKINTVTFTSEKIKFKTEDVISLKRFRHQVVLFENKLFIFGGQICDNKPARFDKIPVVDMNTYEVSWEAYKLDSSVKEGARGSLPEGTVRFACALSGKYALIYGGHNCTGEPQENEKLFWRFDLIRFSWELLETHSEMEMYPCGGTLILDNLNQLYYVGGVRLKIDGDNFVTDNYDGHFTYIFRTHIATIPWNSLSLVTELACK